MPETRCLKDFNKKVGLVENCYFSTYPFRLSDFCVNEILNKSEVKQKIMIAFTIGCVSVNLNYQFFLFFYQTTEALCHQRSSSYLK